MPDGTIRPCAQEIRNVRLGEGLSSTGIQQASLNRLIPVLSEFKNLAANHQCKRIIVVGTHVFRDASNAEAVCRHVMGETGLRIKILSPDEEALWSYHGAVYDQPEIKNPSVVDIGGGSTEISCPDGTGIKTISMNIGAVTLTERHLRSDPPLNHELEAVNSEIDKALRTAGYPANTGDRLIGTGGTVTTLAAVQKKMKQYEADKVHGQNLSLNEVQTLLENMVHRSQKERQMQIQFDPSRADIIIAGTMILNRIMIQGSYDTLKVSDRGLRFGIALREWSAV